jgi:hypothetical protein
MLGLGKLEPKMESTQHSLAYTKIIYFILDFKINHYGIT